MNPRNYRRFKRGDIIVSLAGVATNAIIAVVCTLLIPLLGALGRSLPWLATPASILQVMMYYGVMLNLVLIAFNLLPIPPLDGSHVVKYLLPPRWSLRYQEFGRYGFLLLVLLLWAGGPVLHWWLTPAGVLGRALLGSVDSHFIRPPWLR